LTDYTDNHGFLKGFSVRLSEIRAVRIKKIFEKQSLGVKYSNDQFSKRKDLS